MYQQVHKSPETKKGNGVPLFHGARRADLDVMLVKLPARPSLVSEYIKERRGLSTRVNIVDEIFD